MRYESSMDVASGFKWVQKYVTLVIIHVGEDLKGRDVEG
jgi:hypothetical protein